MAESTLNEIMAPDGEGERLEKKVLVLGLDGAGKSSLLLALSKNDNNCGPEPTDGFNVVSVQTEGRVLNIWEIGGKESMRQYWQNFYTDSDMLVYVVDSSDTARLNEACTQLHAILEDPSMEQLPIIVVANKQDIPASKSREEVGSALGLSNMKQTYHLLCTSVQHGMPPEGITELGQLLVQYDPQ